MVYSHVLANREDSTPLMYGMVCRLEKQRWSAMSAYDDAQVR
jgi:hypothetical protein